LKSILLVEKKEDRLNEFDIEARSQNLKICVDYVFEYFNNYLRVFTMNMENRSTGISVIY